MMIRLAGDHPGYGWQPTRYAAPSTSTPCASLGSRRSTGGRGASRWWG